MGNFEKLSVLVIVVIIVMILVVALYTWTGDPETATKDSTTAAAMGEAPKTLAAKPNEIVIPQRKELVLAEKTAAAPGKSLDGVTLLPSTLGASPFPTPVVGGGSGTVGGAPLDVAREPVKPAEPKIHEVASGDNLTKIAKKYYGAKTTHGIALIRTANSLTDESMLRVGQKLTIPELKEDGKTAIVSGGKTSLVAPSAALTEPALSLKPGSLYTVKTGDTLPRISKRAYGTADKWHEIWLANFNVIDDPEKVSPGTRLKIPL